MANKDILVSATRKPTDPKNIPYFQTDYQDLHQKV